MKIKTMEETILFLENEDILSMSMELLEEHICSFGLNDEMLHEQPTTLKEYFGKGLRIWQYPNQLAPFMKWLCEINVKSYLEIGCRNGGTFIVISEMLRRNNSDIKLIACDLIEESNTLKEYRKFRNFQYIQDSSKNQSFLNSIGNDIEMVFIDGDHSFAGCWGDWTNFSENKNTKYIAFHDIDSFACPDVGRVWETVSQIPTFSSTVFTNQYDPVLIPSGKNYLGLGILTRKNH